MSTPINNGRPAFPTIYVDDNGDTHRNLGMTLRQWYAGQALPAIIAQVSVEDMKKQGAEETMKMAGRAALLFADALIAVEKEKPTP